MSQPTEAIQIPESKEKDILKVETVTNFARMEPLTLQQIIDRNMHLFGIKSRLVTRAVEYGYIIPQWSLIKYMMYAIKGQLALKNDGEQRPIRRFGFANTAVWGVLGAGKSSWSLQLSNAIYGDWDAVLDNVLLTKEDMLKAYEVVQEKEQRIPHLIFDDITTMLPRFLWQEDPELYRVFNKFLAVCRPKIACITSSLPDIGWLMATFSEVLNFEVFVAPNQRYQVLGYFKEPDPYRPAKTFFHKIVVDYRQFQLEGVPTSIFQKYQDRRNALVDKIKEAFENKLAGKSDEGDEAIKEVPVKPEKEKEIKIVEKRVLVPGPERIVESEVSVYREPLVETKPPDTYVCKSSNAFKFHDLGGATDDVLIECKHCGTIRKHERSKPVGIVLVCKKCGRGEKFHIENLH